MNTAGAADMSGAVVPGAVVELRGVGKVYKGLSALSGIDLVLNRGEVVGFVGPNGAGKSTLLKIIAGLVRPSEGDGQVLGAVIGPRRSPAPFVGMMLEKPSFVEHRSGRANLRLLAGIRGLVDGDEIDRILRVVGLGSAGRRLVHGYSQGMRQRLSLAQAWMERPRLILLDEPTNGLDPQGIAEMRGFVRAMAAEGSTVVLASHLLAEVEAVCERVIGVAAGRVTLDYRPGCVRDGPLVELEVSRLDDVMKVLAVPGVALQATLGERVLHLSVELPTAELVRQLVAAGVGVERISPVGASLERLYMERVAGVAV